MGGKKKDLKSRDLNFLLKKLEKEEQIKMQSRQKKGNKKEQRSIKQKTENNKVNEHKSVFLEKTNKIDKLLARLS